MRIQIEIDTTGTGMSDDGVTFCRLMQDCVDRMTSGSIIGGIKHIASDREVIKWENTSFTSLLIPESDDDDYCQNCGEPLERCEC